MAQPINRSWTLSTFGLPHLAMTDGLAPEPAPHELLVKVRAVSLNYKDKLIVEGMLMPDLLFPYVPASDAVGEVIAVGLGVTRFKPGDRVLGHVIADWIDGDAPPILHHRTLGMTLPGVLADYILLDEQATVAAPSGLSDTEASTLPIAALTAWSALVEQSRAMPGETILIQGTGGVSLFALQFAAAFGMRPIVTSSSDDKLARAAKLGAWCGINYAKTPRWEAAVLDATEGRGVDHVLEVVGGDNLGRAVAALAADGRVALIGILAAQEFTLSIVPFMRKRMSIKGISIGHRRGFERMNRAIMVNGIKPVIDSVFNFAEVPKAFERLAQGPFGKVAITVTS